MTSGKASAISQLLEISTYRIFSRTAVLSTRYEPPGSILSERGAGESAGYAVQK